MYLIPLDNDVVYYNATALDTTSLATIFVLSIAYHPTYNNLLYLLYGCTSLASPGSTYGNINIMLRDMTTRQFLQNSTITQNIKCNNLCEIKVTENLFLIQSQSFISIYKLKSDQLIDVISPVDTQAKDTSNYFIMEITRQADIYRNRYVISNSFNSTFGQVTSSAIIKNTVFPDVNISDVMFVGMTDKWVFAAVNYTNITLIFYSCVPCIFNGSLGNSSNISKIIIPTNASITYGYRLYQGIQTSESNITNAWIFVGARDYILQKYFVNETDYQLDSRSFHASTSRSSANSYHYLNFGYYLVSHQFAYSQTDQMTTYFRFVNPIDLASLSYDSKVVAIHNQSDNWNVKQYQIVSDCSLYATDTRNFTNSTQFCECIQYDDRNYCALNSTNTDTSTGSSSGSFPIGAVVGVVAGVVAVAVSVMVVKKNYKKCRKRHRTPWKYNPVQLMSFEV